MVKRRSSTRLRNKDRQKLVIVKPTEKKSKRGRPLLPSKRMAEINASVADDNIPAQASAHANSSYESPTKKKKPKHSKKKATLRPRPEESSTSLCNASQASSATNNDGSIDLDRLVCYNCRSSHDYSDQEKYPLSDPLLDPCNAVLLCDAPNCRAQAYHQRCHFVPIFSIPRGAWICLLCQYEEGLQKKPSKQSRKSDIGEGTLPVKEGSASGPTLADDDIELLNTFDHEAGNLKAEAIAEELSRLGKSVEHSMSNIRTAEHTISFYTNTERLRKELVSTFPRIPSELMHAKIKYSQNKFKIRQQLLSLQRFIADPPPRPEPRFSKRISVQINSKESQKKKDTPDRKRSTKVARGGKSVGSDESETESICESNIICCVCYDGATTPHNDIVLCDGFECKRAFHMKCVRPKLTSADLNSQRHDWFCPFCSKISKLIHYSQETYFGDHGSSPDDPWKKAEDVFPEARTEYRVALLLRERKAPLKALFDETFESADFDVENHLNSTVSDGEDDDEEFSVEDASDDDSSGSDSMSSSNLDNSESQNKEAAKKELANLSGDDEESSNSGYADKRESSKFARGKRRIVRTDYSISCNDSAFKSVPDSGQVSVSADPGEFDVKNIMQGGRRRKKVDYKKLNADLFGDCPDIQNKTSTDDEEFENDDLSDNSNSSIEGSEPAVEKEDSDISDDESDRKVRSTKYVKTDDVDCGNMSSKYIQSKRKRAPIDYKILAGESSSDEGSAGSRQVGERSNRIQKRRRRSKGDFGKAAKWQTDSQTNNNNNGDDGQGSDIGPSPLVKHPRKSATSGKKQAKGKGKSFCTCTRSKCLKLYCLCFSNERPCIEGVCKCRDCGNGSVAIGNNYADSRSIKRFGAGQQPHELLLALKMEEPMREENKVASVARKQRASCKVTDDLPGLLLSLKTTEQPSSCTPLSRDISNGEATPSSNTISFAIGSRKPMNSLKSPLTSRRPFPHAGLSRPLINTPEKSGSSIELPLRCSCRKSSCLKLYCYCNSQGAFCSVECECRRCLNKPADQLATVKQESLLSDEQIKLPSPPRTSSCTSDKLPAAPVEGNSILLGRKHGAVLKNQGCSCRRSKCIKLYCVCWSNKIMCSPRCTCIACANAPRSEGVGVATTGSTEKKVAELTIKLSASSMPHELPPGVTTDSCSCKRSKCLARYCQCYASAFRCTESCTCVGCLNKGSATVDNSGAAKSDGDHTFSRSDDVKSETKE